MATISRSFGDETLLKKAAKEKNKRNVEFTTKDAPLKSKRKSRNITKETNCSEPVNSKTFAGIEQEAEWDHAFGEELSVPVPDLYPELSDSLANLQHRDTEQDQMAKVRNEDEDNVQCVPNTFDDHGLEDNNNPGTSQSQGEFQISSPYNQTQSNKKGKRKLAKPRKVAKSKRVDQGKNTGTATEEDSINFVCVQETGKQGTWAQCSIPSCHKWRFLQDSIDPNEIPERWVCAMNENDNYNTCSVSQETFDSQDGNLNVMYTPYPRGAIVWAKLVGYPWWPAMMEDDPDFGYYCETDDDGVTPVMYHVVFFDKEVSRTWINAFGIRNFSIDDDPEDMGKSVCRGKNYRRQLVAATTEARRAAQMPLEVRLAKYGFAARYKGPIGIKTIEEKESFRNCFDDREFSDSESSSQEIYSSGNSYGTESNNSSSSDELKIKTLIKSSTHKDKPAKRPFQGKPNKSAKAKGSDSSAKKQKEIREKKTQAKKGKKLSGLTTKDISKSRNKCRDNEDFKTQHVRNVSEPSDKRSIEEDLRHNAKYTSVCGTKELQTSDPSVLSTTLDSKQTTSGNEENIKRLHEQRPPENSCSGAKTVKKRRPSFKVERGVKKTNNGEITRDNSGNNLDSIERKDKEEVVEKVATSTKLSTKAPRKKRVSKGQIATEEDAKIDTNPANDAGEDKEIISELSISSKFKLGASKEKQRKGEPHKGDKSTSQCAVTDINKNEDENGTLDSLGNTDKGKSKQSNPRKNQSKKVTKKKSSSPEASGEHGEFKVGNEENKTLRTEVSGGVRTFKDHSEHSENRKPSFVLKRSPACTDLRVSMGEETSQKRKPLPKLKKVFKPPVAKANKVDEVRKLPNLLKPHFVSPARSELEHKSDNQNADREETTQSNIVMKGTMKEVGTKRKASNFDQYHGSETQKKTKDDREKSDVLSEDLQAEISEIDNDIANMKEQLGISDTSNTSISEEKNVSAAADQQGHPDSPEF